MQNVLFAVVKKDTFALFIYFHIRMLRFRSCSIIINTPIRRGYILTLAFYIIDLTVCVQAKTSSVHTFGG